MSLFIGIPNGMKFRLDENIRVRFTHTGHMLGSGAANLRITENGQMKSITYTGDIGRSSSRILATPQPFPQADILLTESTYGNREVSIHGNIYEVKAAVKKIDSYSGHGDYKEMISFLECQDKKAIEKTFLVHGEYETQKNYAAKLKKVGYQY